MVKGIDYTGVTVTFLCHDGQGNYVLHKRSVNARDEHGCWDCGGGGVKFSERIEDALIREMAEEYGVRPLEYSFLGFDEAMREHDGKPTHWLAFRYKVLVMRDQVCNNEPEKIDEIGWFTLDALPEPLHSMMLPLLKKYAKDLNV